MHRMSAIWRRRPVAFGRPAIFTMFQTVPFPIFPLQLAFASSVGNSTTPLGWRSMTHKDYAKVTDREAFIKEHRDLGLFFECAEEVLQKEVAAGKEWFSALPKCGLRQPSLLNTQDKWEFMISRLWPDLKRRLRREGCQCWSLQKLQMIF